MSRGLHRLMGGVFYHEREECIRCVHCVPYSGPLSGWPIACDARGKILSNEKPRRNTCEHFEAEAGKAAP